MKLQAFEPHRPWLILLGASLILLAAGSPLALWGIKAAQQRGKSIAEERAGFLDAARRFDDDMALAARPEGKMSAEDIDRLLAPVDRLRAASVLERQAASAALSHFTYTLAPEKPARLDLLGADNLVASDLTLAADAPLDTDAANFIRGLRQSLPGRVRLRQFSLTRSGDAPLSLANIHMEAEAEWVSNGAGNGKGVGYDVR